MQVVIGHEQAELVNCLEGLAADPEGFRSGCHVRRTVLFLVAGGATSRVGSV